MSDANVNLNVGVRADISQAKARIEELIALANRAAQGSGSGVGAADAEKATRAIAAEISQLRRLADERERALRPTGESLRRKPAVGSEAAIARTEDESAIKKFVAQQQARLSTNFGPEYSQKLYDLAGTKTRQQSFYQSQQYGAAATDAKRIQDAGPNAKAVSDWQKEIENYTARLRGGRQNQEFMNKLLGQDIEEKRFYGTAQRNRNADVDYQRAAVEATIARREGTSQVNRAARADQDYIKAAYDDITSRKGLSDRLKAYQGGYDDDKIQAMGGTEAAAATASWVAAQKRRGFVAANLTEQEIKDAAQDRAAMAARNNAIKLEEKAILRRMIEEGELGGTFVQRKLATWSPGTRTPADFAGGLDNLRSKAFTTVGYAASGVATGLLFSGISDAIQDASKLEATFVRLRGQLGALNRGDQFQGVRSDIKAISTETGIAATDVAEFASRMLGVFSNKGTEYALRETEAAMKLMVVTGIDLNTMMQSVIPTAKAFGVSVEEIGNTAVQVGELLGLSEDQVVEFLGKSATVAKEIGLDMRELAVVGSTMGQVLGKNLSSSADVFNKMPELVQRNQLKIFEILRQSPKTEPYIAVMQRQMREGKTGQATLSLLRATAEEGGLTEVQKQALPKLIANPREVEEATATIANAATVIERLDDKQFAAGKGSNALETRFQKLKDTVSQSFARMQRSVENFAETLFELGIGDLFKELAQSAGLALAAIGGIVGAVNQLNNITAAFGIEGGLINPLIRFGVQAAIITKVVQVLQSLVRRGLGISGRAVTGEAAEAASRQRNAVAASEEAAAVATANRARSLPVPPGQLPLPFRPGVPVAPGQQTLPFGQVQPTPAPYQQLPLPIAAPTAFRSSAQQFGTAGAAGGLSAAEMALLTGNTLGGRIGQWGSTATRASFWSRALSGGGTGAFNPLRGATMGADAAVAQAGGKAGVLAPGMLLPAAGITIAAVAAMKSHYDDVDSQTDDAVKNLREAMKTANRDKLEALSKTNSDIWDRLWAGVFQEDLPEDMAKAGLAYQDSTTGRENLAGLERMSLTSRFAQRVDPKQMEDWLNASEDRRQIAADLQLGGYYEGLDKYIEGDDKGILLGALGDKSKAQKEVGNKQFRYTVRPEDREKVIKKVRELAAEGKSAEAANFARFLGEEVLGSPGNEDLQAAATTGKNLTAIEADMVDKGGPTAYLTSDFETLKRDKEAGRITTGEFLQKAKEEAAWARQIAEGMKDDDLKKEALQAVDGMDTEIRRAGQAAIKRRNDILSSFVRRSGRDDTEQTIADMMVKSLPQYDKETQFDMIPEVLGQLEKGWQESIDAISDPAERARKRLEGFKLPDEVRSLEIEAQLSGDETIAPALKQLATFMGVDTQTLIANIAKKSLETNLGIVETVNALLEERRKKALASVNPDPQTLTDLFKNAAAEESADKDTEQEAKNLIDLGGPQVQQLLGGASGFFNTDIIGMSKLVVEKSHEWNVSLVDAFKRILEERRQAIIDAGGDTTFIDSLLANAGMIAGIAVQSPEQIFAQKRATRSKDLAAIAGNQKADIALASQSVRGDPLRQAQSELDQAWKDYEVQLQLQTENLDDPEARKQALLRVQQQAAAVQDANREVALAQFDWEEIAAHGDPEAELASRRHKAEQVLAYALQDAGGNEKALPVIQARQELARIDNESLDNDLNYRRAQFSVLAARASRDPVKAAEIAQQQAQFELDNARGRIDEQEKLAAKIEADHALEDAVSATFEAKANLAIALAEAAGNPVKAAEIAAKEAKRKLDEAISRGAGVTEVDQLTGEFATASENWAKSGRGEEQAIIDFQLQMGQITTQTAIEGLRAILTRTREGTEEYRQLALKIRQLEQSAGADLQFNLPTQLGLPTLYEARRLNQSTIAGFGYQDNRTVSLVVNVNGTTDAMAVTNQVMSAFSSAMSTGNTYTPRVGVGS